MKNIEHPCAGRRACLAMGHPIQRRAKHRLFQQPHPYIGLCKVPRRSIFAGRNKHQMSCFILVSVNTDFWP